MVATELKLGQSIEIQLERNGYVYRLISKIEERKNNKLYISLITSATKVFQFNPEDHVTVICRTKERIWAWKNARGGIELLDGERVHVLYVEGEAESYNRREAFRVPLGKSCVFFHHRYDSDKNTKILTDTLNKRFDGIIKDISENGVAIVTAEELQTDDFVTFSFSSEKQEISCEAKVVRSMPVEGSYSKKLYGCIITKSSKELARFVIDTQRKQLQNLRSGK